MINGEVFCFLIWDYHQIKTTTTYNCYSTVFTTNSPTTLTSVKHWYWPGAVRGWWVEAIHQRWTPGIMLVFWCRRTAVLGSHHTIVPVMEQAAKWLHCPPPLPVPFSDSIVVCRYKQHIYYLFMFIHYSYVLSAWQNFLKVVMEMKMSIEYHWLHKLYEHQ